MAGWRVEEGMGLMRLPVAVWGLLAGLLAALAGPVRAQGQPDAALLEEALEAPELEEAYEFGPPTPDRARPWTIALWAPVNLRSNRSLTRSGVERGVALEPEWSVVRRWGLGRVTLFGEAGLFVSTMLPDAALDTSGWWGTAEASLDSPGERVSPYVAYEPRGVYRGVLGREIVTFHNLTAGVRRSWGPTALNMFVRRVETGGVLGDQYQLAAHAQHTVPVGKDMLLNLRGDTEWRSFDRVLGERRRDIRMRARVRLFVPLDPAVDLVLSADLQRHWSTLDRFQFTNLVVGPVLSARLRL